MYSKCTRLSFIIQAFQSVAYRETATFLPTGSAIHPTDVSQTDNDDNNNAVVNGFDYQSDLNQSINRDDLKTVVNVDRDDLVNCAKSEGGDEDVAILSVEGFTHENVTENDDDDEPIISIVDGHGEVAPTIMSAFPSSKLASVVRGFG